MRGVYGSKFMRISRTKAWEKDILECLHRSSHSGSAVTSRTSIHEDVGSTHGLAQALDLVLP